ncbi:MAG: hypothetical protein ACOVQK_01045, partial [Cyanobium sp.]
EWAAHRSGRPRSQVTSRGRTAVDPQTRTFPSLATPSAEVDQRLGKTPAGHGEKFLALGRSVND